MELLEIPLSLDYCREWTIVDALREIIANALDSMSKMRIYYRYNRTGGGMAVIENDEGEISKRHLIIGGTTKKDDPNTIGTFGEGLKVGALILLRNGCGVEVESGDLKFTFNMGYSDKFQDSIMQVEVSQQPFRAGTKVKLQVTKADLEAAKQLFIQYRQHKVLAVSDKCQIIQESETGIYLHGVCVHRFTSDKQSIFSYNLKQIKLNRDRTIFKMDDVEATIIETYDTLKDETILTKFLKLLITEVVDERLFESNLGYFHPSEKLVWSQVVHSLFGNLIAVHTNDISAELAQEKGYKVIHTTFYASRLLKDIGIPEDFTILSDGWEYIFTKPSAEELAMLTEVKSIAEQITGAADDGYTIKVFLRQRRETELTVEEEIESLINSNGRTLKDGYWNDGQSELGIRRAVLQDKRLALKVFTHELIHKTGGNHDCTREFEHDILDCLIDMVLNQEPEPKIALNVRNDLVDETPLAIRQMNNIVFQRGHDGNVWVKNPFWMKLNDFIKVLSI